MARRKAVAAETAPDQSSNLSENPTSQPADAGQTAPPADQQCESQSPTPAMAVESHAVGEKRKSTWKGQFDSWGDHEAGVTVIEDRENRLMTIKFDDKPSEAVRTLLKSEPHGFRFDPDNKVWYKRISQARAAQSRREADELAFEASNIIRQEKGLEPKKAFSLGM